METSTLWDILKSVVPAIVTGLIVWLTTRGKEKAQTDATLADAALKWSIEDRAEMVKLRAELHTERQKLEAAHLIIQQKEKEIEECCDKIEELELRLNKLQQHGRSGPA